MKTTSHSETAKEISCRVTRTLLMYVRENNGGTLGNLLHGLELDETYLSDTNNWVSHSFLQILYHRMIEILGNDNTVYNMTLSSERFESLGLLDRIVRLLGNPKLIYSQAPKYNKLLKLNGSVFIREMGDSWVLLEDRYHDSFQKTRFDCDYTRGILAGIPTMFGLPMADVEEIECQVASEKYGRRTWPDKPPHGCGGCLYRVRWNPEGTPSIWKRLFTRRRHYSRAIEDLQHANRLIQAKYDEVKRLVTDLEGANKELMESKRQLESQRSKLIESERKYRLLAENATDIIWILNLETLKFDYISPSVERIRGFTQEEAQALSLEQTVSPQSLSEILKILDDELASDNKEGVDPQRSVTIELQQSFKNGDYAWAEATVSFIRDNKGQPTALIGATRDIQERKQVEKEREKLKAQIQQSQRMESLGTLAGGVAHDFNNLLMSIQGRISLMQIDAGPYHPHFEHLKGIEDSVQSAAGLTKQLLGFARGGKYEVKPTNLNEVIKNQNHMFGRTRKDIDIQEKLEQNLWTVEVDRGQIEQVLLNIYVNAWQAMPGGGNLHIHTENIVIDENFSPPYQKKTGKYVRISITDTGMGMDEATQQRIFDPFFTTKEMGRGTGLGLASAYGIINNHAGFISVDSKNNEGTTFNVYLPASDKQLPEEEKLKEDLTGGTETLLFVDDEEMIIDVGCGIIEKLGYTALPARSGRKAIEIYQKNPGQIDLVILDMIMPDMDGGKTYDKLKEIDPDIKVLLCSGYSIEGQAAEILERGCNGFIQKPFNLRELSKKIREILDNNINGFSHRQTQGNP